MPAKNLREGVELLVEDKETHRTAVYIVIGAREVLRLLADGGKIVIPIDQYIPEVVGHSPSGAVKVDDVLIGFVDDAETLKRTLIKTAEADGAPVHYLTDGEPTPPYGKH
jgi:hypothetical protein